RPRAARGLPRATRRWSRVAVRVGGGVTAFQVDLVCALLERREESSVEAQPALWSGVDERRPALDPVRVELLIPARVQRVGQVRALTVAAQLHHLWASVERTAGGVGGLAHDPT